MHDSHKHVKLHLVLEFLCYNKNETTLKSQIGHYSHQSIKFDLVSEFLQYNKNKTSLKTDLVHNSHEPIELHLVRCSCGIIEVKFH